MYKRLSKGIAEKEVSLNVYESSRPIEILCVDRSRKVCNQSRVDEKSEGQFLGEWNIILWKRFISFVTNKKSSNLLDYKAIDEDCE